MNRWMNRNLLWGSLLVLLVVWGFIEVAGADSYILQVKNQFHAHSTQPIAFNESEYDFAALPVLERVNREPVYAPKELEQRVRLEAEKKRIAPIDARLDRVWKAIPGYNGLEVDIPKTIELMRLSGAMERIPFVYKEIKPKINLPDLGAYPIYKGNPKKPMVSLMINVAWGNEFIPTILEVLNKENVHATFFFDGSWLKNNVDVAKQIARYGHELSNHAYSHKNMSQLGRQMATEEITKTQALLEKELGVHNTLFAPPSGDFSEETVKIAADLKLKTVLWTIDTVDWTNPTPEWIIHRVTKQLEPGSMILMHPTEPSSLALNSIIKEVKRRGLVLGTVSELLSTNRVPPAGTIPQQQLK